MILEEKKEKRFNLNLNLTSFLCVLSSHIFKLEGSDNGIYIKYLRHSKWKFSEKKNLKKVKPRLIYYKEYIYSVDPFIKFEYFCGREFSSLP